MSMNKTVAEMNKDELRKLEDDLSEMLRAAVDTIKRRAVTRPRKPARPGLKLVRAQRPDDPF
jgi:hypothetical protein